MLPPHTVISVLSTVGASTILTVTSTVPSTEHPKPDVAVTVYVVVVLANAYTVEAASPL